MKKWIALILVCLLLAGCGGKAPADPETTAPPETTMATEPPSLYVEGSAEETQSEGALLAYELEQELIHQVYPAGNGVFVVTQSGNKLILRLMAGDTLAQTARKEIPVIQEGVWKVHTKGNAFSCYEDATRTYTFFNAALQETGKVTVPEDSVGVTCLSADLQRIYYTTDTAIRLWDRATNTPRPVREGGDGKTLVGLRYGDTQLVYTQMDGEKTLFFVADAQTGQLIETLEEAPAMMTGDETYYLAQDDGSLLFGKKEGAKMQLQLPEDVQVLTIHMKTGTVLARKSGEALTLLCFDTETGKKTAEISLPQDDAPTSLFFDQEGKTLWLFQGSRLLRWQLEKSPVEDETVYISPVK